MAWNTAKVREDNSIATILLHQKVDLFLSQLIGAYQKRGFSSADFNRPCRFMLFKALQETGVPVSRLRSFIYKENNYQPPLVNLLQICEALEAAGGPSCSDVVATAIEQMLEGKPEHWKQAIAKKLAQRSALSKTA